MRSGRLLVFVFNCDRGNLSAIKDYSQKLTPDKAPDCHLLALISSPVGIKKGWKRYIQELRYPPGFSTAMNMKRNSEPCSPPCPQSSCMTRRQEASLFLQMNWAGQDDPG